MLKDHILPTLHIPSPSSRTQQKNFEQLPMFSAPASISTADRDRYVNRASSSRDPSTRSLPTSPQITDLENGRVRPLPRVPALRVRPQFASHYSEPFLRVTSKPQLASHRSSTDCPRPLPILPSTNFVENFAPEVTVTPASTATPRPLLALTIPNESNEEEMLAPPTPFMAEAPSPTTAKRMRVTKLRHRLGSDVPLEMIYGDKVVANGTFINPISAQDQENLGAPNESYYLKTAMAMRKIIEVDSDSDTLSSDFDSDQDYEDPKCVMVQGAAFRSVPVTKRFSQKWMREQGGRRIVEEDHGKIIHALRKL